MVNVKDIEESWLGAGKAGQYLKILIQRWRFCKILDQIIVNESNDDICKLIVEVICRARAEIIGSQFCRSYWKSVAELMYVTSCIYFKKN